MSESLAVLWAVLPVLPVTQDRSLGRALGWVVLPAMAS